MKLIDNKGVTNPEINLALEEYVLRHFPADSDCLLLYINEPSIFKDRFERTI
jgi:lipoate-protein ligase A